MEGIGAVEHCKNVFGRAGTRCRAYIRQIVTDDDSSTRANLRHSIKATLDEHFGEEGWTKGEHWPRVNPQDPKSSFVPDPGLMPLEVPQVILYLCDISNRVKCIESACYDIKNRKDPRPHPRVTEVVEAEDSTRITITKETKRPPKKPWKDCTPEEKLHRAKNNMPKYDCEKIKVLAGYYLHGNKYLPFQEYHQKAHCIYLHHFNDHSCCNRKWCKLLRCKEDGLEFPGDYCVNNNKFRDKQQHAELFEKVKAEMVPFLTPESLKMCYHPFCTQKNESLNRKSTATAPKIDFMEEQVCWQLIAYGCY
jgi:hypothetical protein